LATTDPAQPYGASLDWPITPGRPARNVSSLTVLRAGEPLVWFDKRGHHLVTFPNALVDPSWMEALQMQVKDGRMKTLEIRKVNGDSISGAEAPEGLVEMLRVAGFADGYRGMTFRA
jgi:ATP-dependent Lhr-like helicase